MYSQRLLTKLKCDSPFGLIGSLAGLREFGGGGGETLLGPFQVFFQQLDASVQGGHFGLSLKRHAKLKK